MEKQPLVSVIVVCYNAAEYIKETLDSVKAQTYKNIELIVSDDCSKDGTSEIVKLWFEENRDSFVRTELITVDHNTGVTANYNRAIMACRGEWVKNIDGDDLITNDCLQLNIDYVQKNPDAQLVFSNVIIFGNNNPQNKLGEFYSLYNKKFFDLPAEDQFKQLLHENFIPSQSCFVRLSLLREYPYNEVYRGLEDEPMWLTLTRNGYKAYYFDKITAYYRKGESTLASSSRFYSPIYVESVFLLFWKEKYNYIKQY